MLNSGTAQWQGTLCFHFSNSGMTSPVFLGYDSAHFNLEHLPDPGDGHSAPLSPRIANQGKL